MQLESSANIFIHDVSISVTVGHQSININVSYCSPLFCWRMWVQRDCLLIFWWLVTSYLRNMILWWETWRTIHTKLHRHVSRLFRFWTIIKYFSGYQKVQDDCRKQHIFPKHWPQVWCCILCDVHLCYWWTLLWRLNIFLCKSVTLLSQILQ